MNDQGAYLWRYTPAYTMSDSQSTGSVRVPVPEERGLPRVMSSRHIFLVKPGARASPLWSNLGCTWGDGFPPLSWRLLMRALAGVHSTEMGVDIPTPELPDELLESGLNKLEIDLDVQVVCLTPNSTWDDLPSTVGFLMAPRSSISKVGLRLANGVGVIDPTYRGNLRARFDVDPTYCGTSPGECLLQVLTPDGGGANLVVVGDDAPASVLAIFDVASTKRGAGAFGSTGEGGTTGEASAGGGAGGAV